MANNITGASLAPIYQRLNETENYHPLEADTFADWSMEAGDVVTITRDGNSYKSPVHNSTVTWKKSHQVSVSSTGTEERETVAKQSSKKYSSGSSALRNSNEIHKRVEDYYSGLYSTLELTSSRLRVEFHSMYDGLSSTLEMTRSRLRVEFHSMYDGLSSTLELTRSRLQVEFHSLYDGLSSTLELTRSRLRVEFHGLYDGLSSTLELTRSRLVVQFQGMYDGLSSTLELTRSRLSVEFHGLYDGLSSTLELTRSRLQVEFKGMYDGLSSTLELTRSRLQVEFQGKYDGLSSTLELTRSRLRVEFKGMYDGLSSTVELTRSKLSVEFKGMYDGLSSTLEVTRSKLVSQFTNLYDGLQSRIEQTASHISLVVDTTDPTNPTIKAAEITAEMNKDGSTVRINANRIKIGDGSSAVTLNDVMTINGTYTRMKRPLQIGTSDSDRTIINAGTITAQHLDAKDNVRLYKGSDHWDLSYDVMSAMLANAVVQNGEVRINDNAGTYMSISVSGGVLTFKDKDNHTMTFNKAASLSEGWSGSNFPLTIKVMQNGSEVDSRSVGFTNASDIYLTVEKNGDPTPFGQSKKLINVPYKLVHHADSPVGDQDRFAGSLASVDASTVYNNGWAAAKAKMNLPASAYTGDTMTVSYPDVTVDGAAATADYKVSVDSSYAYIKRVSSGVTVARVSNSAYSSAYSNGWTAAKNKVSLPSTSNTGDTMTVSYPPATVDGTAATADYKVSADNSYAYIKRVSNGVTVARVSNSAYSNGWTAAKNKVSLPATSNTTDTMTVSYPPTTVDGAAATADYKVSVDSSYAYIKRVSNGVTVARVSNTAAQDGWNLARTYCVTPAESTNNTMQVGIPAVTYNQASYYSFTLSADSSYAYVKNALGTTVMRMSISGGSGTPEDITMWFGDALITGEQTVSSNMTITPYCRVGSTWYAGDSVLFKPPTVSHDPKVSSFDSTGISKSSPGASSYISGRTRANTDGLLGTGKYFNFTVKCGNDVKNYYIET